MIDEKQDGLSRRGFLKGVGGGVVGTAVLTSVKPTTAATKYGTVVGPDQAEISLTVNGEKKNYTEVFRKVQAVTLDVLAKESVGAEEWGEDWQKV